MKRALSVKDDLDQIRTVESLTEVFESIASIKLSKIRSKVIFSKNFFEDLWQTYQELRIDPKEQLKRPHRSNKGRNIFLAVTTEGKLSGGAVDKVLDAVEEAIGSQNDIDLFILGKQGDIQAKERGLAVKQVYQLPESDTHFSISEMIEVLKSYDQISVFYQTYTSLRVQTTKRIELISTIRELGDDVEKVDTEIVSSRNYVFEPGIADIAEYLESMMMNVSLTEIIMESKLAQYASRFNAMTMAKRRAEDKTKELDRVYHRAKRSEADERAKEMIKVLRKVSV